MIGRCVEMNVGSGLVPHLVVDVASDELLQLWAIQNVIYRKWMVLLNLETGRTDVWPADVVSDAGYFRGWL